MLHKIRYDKVSASGATSILRRNKKLDGSQDARRGYLNISEINPNNYSFQEISTCFGQKIDHLARKIFSVKKHIKIACFCVHDSGLLTKKTLGAKPLTPGQFAWYPWNLWGNTPMWIFWWNNPYPKIWNIGGHVLLVLDPLDKNWQTVFDFGHRNCAEKNLETRVNFSRP